MHGFPSTTAPTARRRYAASRFSRDTVRAIRQAVTIATELNLHSVAIAGSVWTIRHDQQEKQLQEPRRSGQQQQQQTAQVTAPREPRKLRRQRRDGERAAAFRARKAAQAPKPQAKEAPPQGEPDERHAPTGTAQQQQQKLGVADAASSPLRAAAAVREGAATAVQSPGAQPKKRGLPRKSPASAKRAARTPTLPTPVIDDSLFAAVVAEVSTVPPSLPPSPPPPSTPPPEDRRLSQDAVRDVIFEVEGGSPQENTYILRDDFMAQLRGAGWSGQGAAEAWISIAPRQYRTDSKRIWRWARSSQRDK
jgi:hypothetical protein